MYDKLTRFVPGEQESEAVERVAEWLKDNEHQPISLLWWAFRRNSLIPANSTQDKIWREACYLYTRK